LKGWADKKAKFEYGAIAGRWQAATRLQSKESLRGQCRTAQPGAALRAVTNAVVIIPVEHLWAKP
jgi:hypothetical protein